MEGEDAYKDVVEEKKEEKRGQEEVASPVLEFFCVWFYTHYYELGTPQSFNFYVYVD